MIVQGPRASARSARTRSSSPLHDGARGRRDRHRGELPYPLDTRRGFHEVSRAARRLRARRRGRGGRDRRRGNCQPARIAIFGVDDTSRSRHRRRGRARRATHPAAARRTRGAVPSRARPAADSTPRARTAGGRRPGHPARALQAGDGGASQMSTPHQRRSSGEISRIVSSSQRRGAAQRSPSRGCCSSTSSATSSASPGRTSAASTASAAPARCAWTARSCARASCSRSRPTGRDRDGRGAASGRAAPVQQAFREQYGLQCGFCTPGMLCSPTAALLEQPGSERGRDPRASVGQHLPLHRLRRIVAAVQLRLSGRRRRRRYTMATDVGTS